MSENPYQAPDAPIIEPTVYTPRPTRVFIAAASCWTVAALMLLASSLYVIAAIDFYTSGEGELLSSTRYGRSIILSILCWSFCPVMFLLAGRSFFVHKGRVGRRYLLVAFVGFVLMVVVYIGNATGWFDSLLGLGGVQGGLIDDQH